MANPVLTALISLRLLPAFVVFAFSAGCVSAPVPPEDDTNRAYSTLWGRNGELWLEAGRLPDFSFAGYRNGERAIPDHPVTADVTAFGARGDDEDDDTPAFQRAIEATEHGAILVPPGRYIISDVLRITRPGVVLRGSGEGESTLYFPKPLNEIEPNWGATTTNRRTSNYSWSGGFVRLQGDFRSRTLAQITEPALRGDRIVTVSDAAGLRVGQTVEIRATDTAANTLARHLYSDDAGDISNMGGKTFLSLVTRIAGIEGRQLRLERGLRADLRPEWRPVVRAFEPTVQDSGVEDLAFEFPAIPYRGHFTELGNNPVAFVNVAHCWARRLRFTNPDSGPMVGGVFNTVADVVYESRREPDGRGNQGHHGIYLGSIGDHLFTRFDIRMRFVHDISLSRCSGVVVSQGSGVDLCFDHHKRAPYANLFTSIDLGGGTRPWASGGGAGLGKHAGAHTTFWNLRANGPLPLPPQNYGPPTMNLVGVNLATPDMTEPAGIWREAAALQDLRPRDLHQAQLDHRLEAAR